MQDIKIGDKGGGKVHKREKGKVREGVRRGVRKGKKVISTKKESKLLLIREGHANITTFQFENIALKILELNSTNSESSKVHRSWKKWAILLKS